MSVRSRQSPEGGWVLFSILFLNFLFFPGIGEVLAQPVAQIKMEGIDFRVRDIESSVKLLEIQVRIVNASKGLTAPSDSIRLVVAAKEVRFLNPTAQHQGNLPLETMTLNVPLPPGATRVMVIALSLPEERIESITFEVQINPPEGEKRMVTWAGS